MGQVTAFKERMAQYRPLLSDDIIVAFESLLWNLIVEFISYGIYLPEI